MADFFSSPLLRWLIVPYRSRLVNVATRPFYQVADRILGTEFLADISEFFILFQSMYDGFVARSEAVGRLLSDRRTTFVVVSTLEAVPLREAEFFAEQLTARKLHLGAIVLNKVLPDYLQRSGGTLVAETVKDRADELAAALAPDLAAADPALGDARPDRTGAHRGGRQLPQLPGGRPPREGGARHPCRAPRRAGDGALLRHRHLRPGRAAPAGRGRSGSSTLAWTWPGLPYDAAMTDIVDPAVEAYATEHTTAPPAHLEALAEDLRATLEAPGMMVGRLEGRFLELLVFALGAQSVLEVGTFGGYSALAMAAGLAPGGTITTCELSPVHAEFARRHIARAPTRTGSRSSRDPPSRRSPD